MFTYIITNGVLSDLASRRGAPAFTPVAFSVAFSVAFLHLPELPLRLPPPPPSPPVPRTPGIGYLPFILKMPPRHSQAGDKTNRLSLDVLLPLDVIHHCTQPSPF